MTISTTLKKKHIQFSFAWLILACFFYFVVCNDGLSINIKDLTDKIAGYSNLHDSPYFSSSEYLLKQISAQIVGQYPMANSSQGFNWVSQSVIVTVSALLWTGLVCAIFYPQGAILKKSTGMEHIDFSRVMASMALFQIVRSVRVGSYGITDTTTPMGDRFLWVPFFIITCLLLGHRVMVRIKSGVTNFRTEGILLLPFVAGLAIISLSWLPPILPMRVGASIELFLIGKFVNSYTIIFNLCMIACCIVMFLLQKKLLKNLNVCAE